MNDFTKKELSGILEALNIIDADPFINPVIYWEDKLKDKIQSMIENYQEDPSNKIKIAELHLREAQSLMSHAMCLLEMKEEA